MKSPLQSSPAKAGVQDAAQQRAIRRPGIEKRFALLGPGLRQGAKGTTS
jgi:hypothetical protein